MAWTMNRAAVNTNILRKGLGGPDAVAIAPLIFLITGALSVGLVHATRELTLAPDVRVDKEERSHDQDASDARLAKNGARYSTHSFRRYFQNGYFVDHNLDNHTFVMPQSIFPPKHH